MKKLVNLLLIASCLTFVDVGFMMNWYHAICRDKRTGG